MLELAGIAAHRGMADWAQSRFERAVTALDAADDTARHGDRAYSLGGVEYRPAMPSRLSLRRSVSTALDVLDTAGVSHCGWGCEAQAFLALCEAMAGDPDACQQLLEAIDAQCDGCPPTQSVTSAATLPDPRLTSAKGASTRSPMPGGGCRDRPLDRTCGPDVRRAAERGSRMASTGAYHEALLLLDEIGSIPSIGDVAIGHRGRRTISRAWLMSRLGRHAQATRSPHPHSG